MSDNQLEDTQPLPAAPATPPPVGPRTAPSKWLLIPAGLIIGLVATPLLGLLVPLVFDFGIRSFFLTWMLLAGLVVLHIYMQRTTADKQVLRDWQRNINIVQCSGAPEELIRRVAYKFTVKRGQDNQDKLENIVENATRKHAVKLCRNLLWPIGVLILRMIALPLVSPVLQSLGLAESTYVRIFIGTTIMNLLWVAIVIQEWRHELLVVTNFHVWEIKYRPPSLWFLLPNDDSLLLSKVLDTKMRQTHTGLVFNYGVLRLGTAMQDSEDEPYHNINYIPNAEVMRQSIAKRML